VTIDLFGLSHIFDSKTTTSLTVPRLSTLGPSKAGPVKRVTGALPWAQKAALPFAQLDQRISNQVLRENRQQDERHE